MNLYKYTCAHVHPLAHLCLVHPRSPYYTHIYKWLFKARVVRIQVGPVGHLVPVFHTPWCFCIWRELQFPRCCQTLLLLNIMICSSPAYSRNKNIDTLFLQRLMKTSMVLLGNKHFCSLINQVCE